MKHIYIIEDDVSILEGLSFLLEPAYKITALTDARIALNKLRSDQPDLILLDIFMPDLDGVAFLKAFEQQSLKIPILVMSGGSNENIQQDKTIAGFIRKPFQIEEMVTTIERVLF